MFESARLGEHHQIGEFDCGKTALNSWLHGQARRADSSGVANVYVWTRAGEKKVCAYYAICPTEVIRSDVGISGALAGGYSRIPGYLIARLALDASLHGRGHGAQLLLDAVDRVVKAAEIGGGRLIVVDAADDDAYEFYERFDFAPVKNRRGRLVMKMSTAASALRGVEDQR